MILSYVLGQYNKVKGVDDAIFLTQLPAGVAKRKASGGDAEVVDATNFFDDECVQVDNFTVSKSYYFHGKIKRMSTDQTFYVKLVYYNPEGPTEEGVEQYIKTINVSKGDIDEWVDVEFLFAPLLAFDCLLFELQRTSADYKIETRYPKIAYEELSEINNIIPSKINDGAKLIKIGVQSHPGLLMCLNGEEIRTCRTGIYELRNGMMTISFFSVVAPLKEHETFDASGVPHSVVSDWTNSINAQIDDITARQEAGQITNLEAEELKKAISSKCFFDPAVAPKDARVIDSFTLDYMYEQD